MSDDERGPRTAYDLGFVIDTTFSTPPPRAYKMPTTATLRPISGEIAPEAHEGAEFGQTTLRMRYQALTTKLPLMGASAMRRTP